MTDGDVSDSSEITLLSWRIADLVLFLGFRFFRVELSGILIQIVISLPVGPHPLNR
jgi:hypothetical protein